MKIYLYEVREDERDEIARQAERLGVKVSVSGDVPTLENAGRTAYCDGVSVLGQGTIDKTLLEKYASLGVRYLSTRTVGYDHIDLQAARQAGIAVCNADYPPDGVADFTVMRCSCACANISRPCGGDR